MARKRQDRGAASPAALGLLGLLGLLAVLVGTTLGGAALLAQVPDPPRLAAGTTSTAGTVTARDRDGPGPRAAEDSAGPSGRAPGADGTVGAEQGAAPTQDRAAAAVLAASEPVALRAPTIGVESPLHALGLAADGTLEVPTGALVDEAAWYDGSPTPGETGPSVIEGHVTGPGGRPSVFFELAALAPGDLVEVDRTDGGTVAFEVYRVDSYPKENFPTVAVYGPTPGPELRLITCGGEFDDRTGHHVDNTVVYARLLPDDPP
jgi:hypothetical protein